jgi:GR25 family glycosyltransferase involved in LPS biosynthesis
MKNKINVIIISLKKSKRISKLKKRLKKIKVNYKIIEGIDGKLYKKNNNLNSIYDKKSTLKNIGRELADTEIGCAASHLKAYNYIIKHKIEQAIVMEDDSFPSKFLYQWIKNNTKIENNKILNFYCYPYGFINKIPYQSLFNDSIKLHNIIGHSFGAACYQINNFTCRKIISLTRNKVIGLPDWPFSIALHKIELAITLPFLAFVDDEGWSHLQSDRKKKLKENYFIKKLLHSKIINILRVPYYLSYLPYFSSKYPNKYFYHEHYVQRIISKFKNFIFNNYLEMKKIYYNKNYYFGDLKKIVKFPY